jgi:hypothetical protein
MELALLLQLVLVQLDLQPLTQQRQQHQKQQQQQRCTPGALSQPGVSPEASHMWGSLLLPRSVLERVRDVAVFGLGSWGGSTQQEQQWLASGVAASGVMQHSSRGLRGPEVRLPSCELKRLVGFKVPAEPWWADVRSAAG